MFTISSRSDDAGLAGDGGREAHKIVHETPENHTYCSLHGGLTWYTILQY